MTLCYKVRIKSHVCSDHFGFGKYGSPIERLLRRSQKVNLECFSLHVCQISVLVDKSAQSSPLEPGLLHYQTSLYIQQITVSMFTTKGTGDTVYVAIILL